MPLSRDCSRAPIPPAGRPPPNPPTPPHTPHTPQAPQKRPLTHPRLSPYVQILPDFHPAGGRDVQTAGCWQGSGSQQGGVPARSRASLTEIASRPPPPPALLGGLGPMNMASGGAGERDLSCQMNSRTHRPQEFQRNRERAVHMRMSPKNIQNVFMLK